tara:strand:- start:45 stop:635 length:591 start_codon:yes stop_codon:yes gene_type:complete
MKGKYGVLRGRMEIHHLELPKEGRVHIVALADTHSHPHKDGLELVAAERPNLILHGGDIGDITVLDTLGEIAPVIAVRGNIDSTTHDLPTTIIIKWTRDDVVRSTWLLTHIAVRGPRLYREIVEIAEEHSAQLVICGHSHVPFIGRDKGLAIFNPGSIGPRRFALPITYGTIKFSLEGIDLKHINCETGEPLRVSS